MRARRLELRKAGKRLCKLALPVILMSFIALPLGTARAEEKNKETRVLRDKRYYYKAFNRRDPFQSLVDGDFEESEFDLIDIYSVRLVGILSGEMERFAMLEDNDGFGYIIKAGRPIRNGRIVSVGDRLLVARVTVFGQTNSVTLRMEDKKRKGE